ncbi:MAG: hypothetical protein QOF53_2955 [Nocardioidaceae bacterium]|jgi:hypothetical protein|nr:hypothetical protein [Nocardioidaceae bacterium]
MTLRSPFFVGALHDLMGSFLVRLVGGIALLGALAHAVVVTRVESLSAPTTVRTQGAAV